MDAFHAEEGTVVQSQFFGFLRYRHFLDGFRQFKQESSRNDAAKKRIVKRMRDTVVVGVGGGEVSVV
jgi:hypothetical protein